LAICVVQACGTPVPSEAERKKALYVPSEAIAVRWQGDSATFTISEPYPAQGFVSGISRHFTQIGWVPRDDLIANPGHKMSDTREGWADPYIDNGSRVFKWAANFESPKGEIVVCYIEYRTPEGTSVDRQTAGTVLEVYMDPATADTMKRR
jgi:hypothetical protein